MTAALILFGGQLGCRDLTSAATPAVTGAAIDVPEMTSTLLPVPTPAEAIVSPGAVTSGFTTPIEPCVPREVNEEMVSVMPGFTSLTEAARLPSKVTFRVPASTAGRSLSVPVFGS